MTINEQIEAQAAIVNKARDKAYDAQFEYKLQLELLNKLWDRKLDSEK